VAVFCTALVMVALRSFIEDRTPAPGATATLRPGAPQPPDPVPGPPEGERSPRREGAAAAVHSLKGRVLTGRLLLVGVVTLCATTLEGAAADWLALFLTEQRGGDAQLGAAAHARLAG